MRRGERGRECGTLGERERETHPQSVHPRITRTWFFAGLC